MPESHTQKEHIISFSSHLSRKSDIYSHWQCSLRVPRVSAHWCGINTITCMHMYRRLNADAVRAILLRLWLTAQATNNGSDLPTNRAAAG